MFPRQYLVVVLTQGVPLATIYGPLHACAAANAWEMRGKCKNNQFYAIEKLKHQNRTIFKEAMGHDVRPLHHAKMMVKFACRPCSKPFYTEGNVITLTLLTCSRPPTCPLILHTCKDMNRLNLQIAHALHGQICPNSQTDP